MATLDFAPLFRTTVGFDQLPDLYSKVIERNSSGYPPYDIERVAADEFRIVVAVAGFSLENIEIIQAENRLIIKGVSKDEDQKDFIYRGIAARPFAREFDLANYVDVTSAELVNGLLVVSLKRVLPDAMKPRTIPIRVVESPAVASGIAKQAA